MRPASRARAPLLSPLCCQKSFASSALPATTLRSSSVGLRAGSPFPRRIVNRGAAVQKRGIFNMFREKWKKPFRYVVNDEGAVYMKGEDVVAEFKFKDINKIGIRHESRDNRSLYLQWVIGVDGSKQLFMLPYDEELPGHAELLERLLAFPDFKHRAFANALLSRRASPEGTKVAHLVWERSA